MLNTELIEHMLDVFGYAQTIIYCEMKSYEASLVDDVWEYSDYDKRWFAREARRLKEEFISQLLED